MRSDSLTNTGCHVELQSNLKHAGQDLFPAVTPREGKQVLLQIAVNKNCG